MPKKKASAKGSATASAKRNGKGNAALPPAGDIPEGMKQLGGGYAPTWKPETGDSLHGNVSSAIRTVEMKIGRKVQERRVFELTTKDDQRFAVWESAALSELFEQVEEAGVGFEVYIRFDGLGTAKKGQNPPKLFTVAAAA